MRKAGVTEEEVAYMGDDLPDISFGSEGWAGGQRSRWRCRS